MIRIIVAVLVVAGLAFGIWLLWPGGDTARDTATTVAASPTTTTTVLDVPATTLPADTTTSSVADSHVVETVEEAEEILRELWFGWFEGIYNQDEDRIREVVATEEQTVEAISVFGANFVAPPSKRAIGLADVEILRSDRECLATWAVLDVSGFRDPDAITGTVLVARRSDAKWKILSTWTSRGDLWEADCEVLL